MEIDLNYLHDYWPELYFEKSKIRVYLRDILLRFRGEIIRGGKKSLIFDHVEEEHNPFILSIEISADKRSFLMKWDDEKQKWDNLGQIIFIKEWGMMQFRLFWKQCFIKQSSKIISLEDDFDCNGEKAGGLLFIGKGKRKEERMILRFKEMDPELRLEKHSDPQECEILVDEENDKWEPFGWLHKKF